MNEESLTISEKEKHLREENEEPVKTNSQLIEDKVLDNPENYINRELSWLRFNQRVLEEAQDKNNPLLERIRFLTICESNLDEYFMVRVASLKQKIANEIIDVGADGMSPREQLDKVHEFLNGFYEEWYKTLNAEILPELETTGITFPPLSSLSEEDRTTIEEYFRGQVFPILTPLAIDPGHPFPRLANRSLNVAVLLKKRKQTEGAPLFAVVQVPSLLNRLIRLPSSTPENSRYVWLEDIILQHLGELFSGFDLLDVALFKITRDSDIIIEEDEVDDLLMTIQAELRRREKGAPVRLEVKSEISPTMSERLRKAFQLQESEIFFVEGAIPLSGYKDLFEDPLLKPHSFDPFTAITSVEYDHPGQIYGLIRKQDIPLHHPYDSFSIVEDFISNAADDPSVLGIKMTLYRTGGKSRILDALIRAARNGKQVTALVELKARFDEETNIQWAKKLEAEGIHVVYGLMGFKTHGKVTLILRKEEDKIERYVHLATGNYNGITARLYTDTGLLTKDAEIAEDITHLFNSITGYAKLPKMNKIFTSPGNLKRRVIELIRMEAEHAQAGRKSGIIAKMNSLVDADVIRELYLASAAGVQIDLIIRGICCVRPGVEGLSENIRVRSIVGRLLEHSRIFVFENDGDKKVYEASADWMPRNFNRRIETMYPLEDPKIQSFITEELLPLYLADNVKTRVLHSDGTYEKLQPAEGEEAVNVQETLIARSRRELERREKASGARKNITEKEKKLFED